MKIALTSDYFYPNTGGAEQSALEMCKAISNKGHEVIVFTRGEGEIEHIQGLEVRRIFKDLKKGTYNNDVVFPKRVDNKEENRFFEEIKNEDFDILHSNNRDTAVFTANVGDKLNIPCITHIRDYWPLCPKRDFLRPGGTCSEPEKCWSCMAEYYNKWHKIIFYRKAWRDTKYRYSQVENHSDYFIYNSEYVKNRIDLKPGEVVYNPINIDKIKKGEAERGKILYIGNITKRKGVKILVNAFKSIKNQNLSLHLVGEGYLLSDIEGNNIVKYGRLDYDKVLEHFGNAEMLIVPSIWPEPFGRVAVEGMTAGIPVIVADSGGLPEAVDDAGIIVKREDERELKNKILELHKNQALRKKISNKALKRSKEFSPSNISEQVIEIYRKFID